MTTLEEELHALGDLPMTLAPSVGRDAWRRGRRSRRTQLGAGAALGVVALGGVGAAVAASLPSGPTVSLRPGSGGVGLGASGASTATQATPAAQATPATLKGLSLPATLPGYPRNLFTDPVKDSYDGVPAGQRLWGWDAKPYVIDATGPGYSSAHPGGPQLRLVAADRPDAFAADNAGRQLDGVRTVRGAVATLSHDKDDLWLTVTLDGISFQAQGGSGATVDDLVMAVDAVQGL